MKKKSELKLVEWIAGGLSFVPLLGFLFGPVSLILGSIRLKNGGHKIIFMGLGGLVLNVIYITLLMTMITSKISKASKGFSLLAKDNLVETVKDLEYYKLIRGKYPEKLKDLVDTKNGWPRHMSTLMDTSTGQLPKFQDSDYFQYGLLDGGQHYYLFGVGPDGIANTADDVYPDIATEELDHIGYRKKP